MEQRQHRSWWEPAESAPVLPSEVIAWVVLLVWVWASRWMVAPDVLFDWDAVNYALAMADFDVYEHQPHPPGYPVFVLLLRAFSLLGGDEVTPFLISNGLYGSAILLLVGWMVRSAVGRVGALVVAAGLSVCPPFWFQGAATTAYVAECFCSVAIASVSLAAARRRVAPWVAGLVVALVLGIRPSAVMTLPFVAAVGVLLGRPSRRELLVAVAAGAVGCSSWFFPLILFGGGYHQISVATEALTEWQMTIGSALGGDLDKAWFNGEVLWMYLVDSVNLFALVPFLAAPMMWRVRLSKGTLALLGAWFVPGVLVYTFHHLAKSGYVLTLVPVVFVTVALVVGAVARLLGPWARRAWVGLSGLVAALYLVVNVTAFQVAVPRDLLYTEDARLELPDHVYLTGDYGRMGLRYRVYSQQRMHEILESIDPERDLVVYLFGSHELQRIASFYHPDQWSWTTSLDHRMVHATPHTEQWPASFGDFQVVVLLEPSQGVSLGFRTTVSRIEGGLRLTRKRKSMDLAWSREPRKVVVVYPCPPCEVKLQGLTDVHNLHIGVGYGAIVGRP